ncbi:MAG: hypothetical protein AAGN15_23350 [Cyanobacteria bacterium J06581_3]
MVTPAPPGSNSEQYTAGSCVLEVQTQPSALSQWSPRPIAGQLTFQLWLGVGSDARSLIAEGDRTDLQELFQYVQYQTQQVLAIAALNRSRQAAQPPPQRPQSLQITALLSYLQLADVTAVLSQCEQSARLLPVELGAEMEAIAPASNPDANVTNVVSLAEARRRGDRIPARRKRNSLWMSSAAAALFAVGLTSTLWLRDSSLQQLNTGSESAAPAPQTETAQSETARSETVQSDADDAETDIAETDTVETQQQPETEGSTSAEPSPPSAAESARSGNAAPAPSAPPAASRTKPSQNATVAEGTTADRQTTTESPSADTSSTEARPEQSSSPSASDASPPESASPPAPSPSSPASSTPEVSTQAQRSPAPQDSPESSEQVSVDGSVERAAAEQPIPSAEREPENVFAPPPSAGAPTAQTGGASRGRSPNSAPARETARETAREAPREAPREAVVLPGTEDITAASEDADTTADFPAAERSQVIEQVRTYFDQRWQADETDSLRYQLALSETGEVLRFEGMDEASRREGDRILPSNPPPSLPVGTLPRPITLRVFLLPNGDVQVLEL